MARNIVIDEADKNITIYTTKVEKVISKQLTNISPPTSPQNRGSGPKNTISVDLLRVKKVFNIDGYVESTDRDDFENLILSGGTFTLKYRGNEYNVNTEKIAITEEPEDADIGEDPEFYTIKASFMVGEDYGTS